MKNALPWLMLLALCALGLSSGCGTGTVRGMGSDIESLGKILQR